MSLITTNMGLKIWNLLTDLFSHTDLANNFAILDAHNHSNGQGVQIPTGGLAPGAVTNAILSSALAQSASVNLAGQTAKGFVSIPTTGTRTSTSYGELSDAADAVSVVLPANGLIAVWYQALWQDQNDNAGRAAIFLNASQLQIQQATSGLGPGTQAAYTGNVTTSTVNRPLATFAGGLFSVNNVSGSSFTADVTTGQVVGYQPSQSANFAGVEVAGSGFTTAADLPGLGGPCYIFAAAGTYAVSVQFKATSGSVTASNRKLWVQALSFA